MNGISALRICAYAALFAIGSVWVLSAGSAIAVVDRPAALSRAASLMPPEKATHRSLLSVTRAGDRLVAVGDCGLILLSDDSGRTWRQGKVPVSVSLVAVKFVSPKVGWAVGHLGVVLRSSDGGETWTKQLDGVRAAELALSAAEQSQDEKALTAARQLISDGPDKPFLDVHFANETDGFVVGAYGLVFRTLDGGNTWQPWQTKIDNPNGNHLYAISAEGNELIIAGEQGFLAHSDNGGNSLSVLKGPYKGSYFGAVRGKQGLVLLFGLRGNAFRSTDQGLTWTKIEIGTSNSVSSGIRLSNGSFAMISDGGEIALGDEGGNTFHPLPMNERFQAAGIAEADDGALIIVGLRGVRRIASIPAQ